MASALLALFLLSFVVGRYGVPLGQVVRILLSGVLPLEQTWTGNMAIAVLNVRLPRILLACLVGCGLSAAGTGYQTVFQNPMAAPDILGASSGACFGAALAILTGQGAVMITVFAFLASLLSVALVYLVGNHTRGNRVVNLLLAGIMVGSLFSACTSYIKLVADPTNQLPQITYWLMGSLAAVTYHQIALGAPFIIAGVVVIVALRWQLNILSLSEDEARSAGVNVSLMRAVLIVASTVITASVISMCGQVGWVGLLVPHCARMLCGQNNRAVIPVSLLLGSALMIVIDTLARSLSASEIPISILTAIIGAPFFIVLLRRTGGAR